MEWPQPFGRTMSAAEETIHAADEKTGLLIFWMASMCHDCNMFHAAAAAGRPDHWLHAIKLLLQAHPSN
jgi:hypothetical protein